MIRRIRALVGALASLAAGACADVQLPTDPGRTPLPQAAAAASGNAGRFDSPLVSGLGGAPCLATAGGSSAVYTAAVVSACNQSAGQVLGLPAVGTAGLVTLFNGSVCLDNWGARGQVGDPVGTWHCVAGAPTQTWTLTSAGELRMANGLCVQAAAGAQLTLQTCTGAASQRWALPTPPSPAVVSALDGACMEVRSGGSPAQMQVVATAACVGGAQRQAWGVPAAGTPGMFTVSTAAGTLCLDNWGARGRVGDPVGTWTCVSGAPTQTWTLTGAGELRGVNGLCVQAAPGAQLTLQTCTGAANQRWSTTGGPTTPSNYLVFYGSSTTEGYSSSDLARRSYVGLIVNDAYFAQWQTANRGVAGQQLVPAADGIVADAAQRVATGRRYQIALVMHGSNDLAAGTSPQTTYSTLVSVTNRLRGQGWTVVWVTPQSRSAVPASVRQAYCDLMANGFAGGAADALADVRSDPVIGDDAAYTGPYYADGTHFNDAGHARLAPLVKTAILSAIQRTGR